MIFKRTGILLLASTFVSGAFAADSKSAADDARPDDLICTYEQPMGSHIKRRVCATRQAREEQRQADAEALQRLRGGKRAQGRGDRGPAGP